MEKILSVVNARHPNVSSIRFACSIAAQAHSQLIGLFIENLFYPPLVDVATFATFNGIPAPITNVNVQVDTAHAIELFVRECSLRHITDSSFIYSKMLYETKC